jgi:hypothetical protein
LEEKQSKKKRRQRYNSDNVEDKKIKIKNSDWFSIDENYFKNKNNLNPDINSNSNLNINCEVNSNKFKRDEEKHIGFFNLGNQRKLSSPMYYSDYFTVI